MSGLEDMSYENFRKDVCGRCDILYDLRRRKVIISKIYERFVEELKISDEEELKYDVGAEGVKNVYKNKCMFIDKCPDAQELIIELSENENRLSKLMYYLMQEKREKDVTYISADIDPFYPVLSNRIIRCDASKVAVLHDKYDTKDLLKKSNTNE